MDLISIIIPYYNTEKYVKQCLESVKNQTYSNIEIIVIDDGSTSESNSYLKSLHNLYDVLIEQNNKGQSSARNKGLNIAKGRYVFFVDSDDYISLDCCEKLVKLFNDKSSVVTCGANLINKNGIFQSFVPIGGNINEALKINIALGTSMFIKSELINIGGYDEEMKSGFEDWEMLIRLLNTLGKNVIVNHEMLYYYRKDIFSTTIRANKIKYDLLRYIYFKHEDLYKNYYTEFIEFLLEKIEREEIEKLKMYERKEYKIGLIFLLPYRFIKKIIKWLV